jgi:hypothetical protein
MRGPISNMVQEGQATAYQKCGIWIILLGDRQVKP